MGDQDGNIDPKYRFDNGSVLLTDVTGQVYCPNESCRVTLALINKGTILVKSAISIVETQGSKVDSITLRCGRCKAYTSIDMFDPGNSKRRKIVY